MYYVSLFGAWITDNETADCNNCNLQLTDSFGPIPKKNYRFKMLGSCQKCLKTYWVMI